MGPCKAQHGFARNTTFEIIELTSDSVTMELSNDTNAATYPEFPYAFTLKCKVTVSNGSLEQELLVNNLSPTDSFPFTTALHT